MLAEAYYDRSGDLEFITAIWPNIQRALDWIDHYGDPTKTGFVTYDRQSSNGLVHQGWKDSHDAVFHSDGTAARGPIALCEVQAYVYRAKKAAADLARLMGDTDRAEVLVSFDGETWVLAGTVSGTGELDIPDPLISAQYVKVVDAGDSM